MGDSAPCGTRFGLRLRYGAKTPNRQPTAMSRLTITLNESRYLALKEASARRGKSIGQLIDESLEFYGIKTREEARSLVQRARQRADLDEAEAMPLAVQETRHQRQ